MPDVRIAFRVDFKMVVLYHTVLKYPKTKSTSLLYGFQGIYGAEETILTSPPHSAGLFPHSAHVLIISRFFPAKQS